MSNPLRLEYSKSYHIYNRGNNRENLFFEERNYHYFLKLYAHHIIPIADTFAYCLLRNHFHFSLRVKNIEELPPHLKGENFREPSQYFANFFNAYTRSVNNMYGRSGALFHRPFGRVEVGPNAQFRRLIVYIHQNAQHHNFVEDFRDWPFTSYHTVLSLKKTLLKRDDVISWFEDREKFSQSHETMIYLHQVSDLVPVD